MVPPGRLRLLGALLVVGQAVLAGCLGAAPPSGSSPETVQTIGTTGVSEGVTYYPENDTVRFVALQQGSEAVESWNTSFEEYASWQCDDVAMRRIGGIIEEEFENESIVVGYGSGSGTVDVDYLRSVERERVDRALPDRVETTIELFDRTHTCTVPVDLNPSSGGEPMAVAH